MESNGGSNPLLGLMGFWMTMGLISTLALLLGGLYALYCLGRAASGLDRLASAIEEMVRRGDATPLGTETHPFVPPVPPPPAPPAPPAPPVPAVPVTAPGAPGNATGMRSASGSVSGSVGVPAPPTGTSNREPNSERQSDDYSR